MGSEAEQYKEEDEKQRKKIAARNQLERYIFQVKQVISDCADKLSSEDKAKIESECLRWLDNNTLAEKEEYEDRQKQPISVCSPIMAKLYKDPVEYQELVDNKLGFGGQQRGPTIEEVD